MSVISQNLTAAEIVDEAKDIASPNAVGDEYLPRRYVFHLCIDSYLGAELEHAPHQHSSRTGTSGNRVRCQRPVRQ